MEQKEEDFNTCIPPKADARFFLGWMMCSLAYPNWQLLLYRPMAWLEVPEAVADLLDLSLKLVCNWDNIRNTQKHKIHPKLPLRVVTPELPQSSHVDQGCQM